MIKVIVQNLLLSYGQTISFLGPKVSSNISKHMVVRLESCNKRHYQHLEKHGKNMNNKIPGHSTMNTYKQFL